jgi:hypothetical protein
MKCENIKELLSAYVDSELTDTQRNLVEEHLAGCADCRAILADYTEVRKQLLSLQETPPLPDVEEATMTKIKMVRAPAKLRRWLRPALVAASIIIILAIVLPLQLSGSPDDFSSVIAKAYAATEKLESYRLTTNGYHKERETDELVHDWYCNLEYANPDRYHLIAGYPEEYQKGFRKERTIIDDQVYTWGASSAPNMEELEQFTPTKEQTLELLTMLIDMETMPDDIIDGTDCFHYQGTVDIEKLLAWERPARERRFKDMIERYPNYNFDLEEMVKRAEDMWRTKEITGELWVGKDDYLIRQWKEVRVRPHVVYYHTSVAIFNYYDFNEPIVIEPPLTESGELLEGWVLTTLEE